VVNIDVSIILALLAIVGSFITYITAANKLRFEVTLLKEESKEQAVLIEANKKDLADLRERGSIKTRQLEERVVAQERNTDSLRENLVTIRDGVNELKAEIRSMNERFAVFGFEERWSGTRQRRGGRTV
jgi:septal ring factor EnvC (AmiA/AmiB activator)